MTMPKFSGDTKALMGTIAAAVVTIIGAVAFLDMKSSARMDRIEARISGVEERLTRVEGRLIRVEAEVAEVKAEVAEVKRVVTGRGQIPVRPSGK